MLAILLFIELFIAMVLYKAYVTQPSKEYDNTMLTAGIASGAMGAAHVGIWPTVILLLALMGLRAGLMIGEEVDADYFFIFVDSGFVAVICLMAVVGAYLAPPVICLIMGLTVLVALYTPWGPLAYL